MMTSPVLTHSALRQTHGFTLVEVLVALVVLSVGMLGIVGLQVASLRSGSGAIYRMQAVNLASDLADRIRANRTAIVAYAGGAADNSCVDGGVDCTPAQMAANDLLVWRQQITAALPSGAGAVQVVAGVNAPSTYQITLTWSEPGEDTPQTYTLGMQL